MKKNSPLLRTVLLLTLFSIAMGFLEAAVVIYMREMYYPNGFKFPLIPIPTQIALVEILREAATVIMLASIGILAGKNKAERFSFFLFCFAVWDIIYYVVLKLFLHWPESFLTPDILFLIPIPWVGPVITPCIISVTMIVLTMIVVYYHQRDIIITINKREWLMVNCETQEEVDNYWNKLIADGGEESMCGWCKDKFGLSWQIIPSVLGKYFGDADRTKANRAIQAMFQMRKIDIAKLTDAFEGK